MVEIAPVTTASERRIFVRSAAQFYREWPAWVPPMEFEVTRLLDPMRNPYFRVPGNDAAFFLARREGQVVGRIGAIRNAAHLATHQDAAGFFGFFECENDPATARVLLDRAEAWLRERGLRVARGPANFTVQEEAGVLLDGFDLDPMLGMTYTPPYYRTLFEAVGYATCRDLLVYRVDDKTCRFDLIHRAAAVASRRRGIVVRSLDPRALAREAEFFACVFAEAWRENWGAVPISAAEFLELYTRYRFFLVPELVYLAEVDGEPAAAFVTMPDLNVLVKKARGRLWPLGWWWLLTGRGGIKRARTLMMGVRPAYRHLGLPAIFISRCHLELKRRNTTLAEFSWILEDNREIRAILERIGAWRAQTLRLYEKALA